MLHSGRAAPRFVDASKMSFEGNSTAVAACRLCGAAVADCFKLLVLNKYSVAYQECSRCGSLQTEFPYWSAEAYSDSHLATVDTGAAQRNLVNLSASYATARGLRLSRVLDYGAGDGLLCRLLRDHGVDCYAFDRYAASTYAAGFTLSEWTDLDLMLLFEVFEHFQNPSKDLGDIFHAQPKAILASTCWYSGQDSSWWYLTPETGQHVFFYTRRALRSVARAYGYDSVFSGSYVLLVRLGLYSAVRLQLLRVLLNQVTLRLLGAGLRLLPTPGVWRDFYRLSGDSKKNGAESTRDRARGEHGGRSSK
jgi:hypothetical protein